MKSIRNILVLASLLVVFVFFPLRVNAQFPDQCDGGPIYCACPCGWCTGCTCEPTSCTCYDRDMYGVCHDWRCTNGGTAEECGTCYSGPCEPTNTPNPTATAGPGGPTDTPIPTATPIPIGPGTIQVRGKVIAEGVNMCSQLADSTTYVPETIDISPVTAPGAQAISGGTYATWSVDQGTYTVLDTPPAGYVLSLACFTGTNPGYSGGGMSSYVLGDQTMTWELGYTIGKAWTQATGGDVYASTDMKSYIPSTGTTPYFISNGSGGSSGVATYGVSYDFDSLNNRLGESKVSPAGWLANETYATTDYYAIMFHRFGSPETPDATGPVSWTGKPADSPLNGQAYYIDGDLTIVTNDWLVGTGESITVLVNGNLTINTRINITGKGFVAFIVNGDITVGSSVGTTAASSTSVVDGVYITSPTGTFHTGASTTAAARKFVGKGTFVAGNFVFERSLEADVLNNSYPSELFVYNPKYLLTMPESMKDLPITWQEVAP